MGDGGLDRPREPSAEPPPARPRRARDLPTPPVPEVAEECPAPQGTTEAARTLGAVQHHAGNRAARHLVQRWQTAQRQTPPAPAAPAPAAPAAAAQATGLVVDDTVSDLRPEQLRRSDFMVQARAAAHEGATAAAGPGQDLVEPELEATSARYAGQSAAQLEGTVRAEVPGAAQAATAAAMVAAVREAAGNETRSRFSAGVSDHAAAAADAVVGAASSAISAVTSLFFKVRDGASPAGDVERARGLLGRGHPVTSPVRSEVERLTGDDLSGVRLHTAGPAPALADEMGARAFTVGHDVVIAPGQPGPGSPEGDALLAHELAHATQQDEAAERGRQPAGSDDAHGAAEEAADVVAADATLSLWTGTRRRLESLGPVVASRIRTGLRLQRCGGRVDPTKEALNKKTLEGMKEANAADRGPGRSDPQRGIYYPFRYETLFPAEWKRLGSPKEGYADPKYWDRRGFMHWVRRPGVSASEAMDAFFRGPTIADCASVATASEINAVRAAIGDGKFDALWGGARTRPKERNGKRESLEIGQGYKSSVLENLMRDTPSVKEPGAPGNRNVSPGELHYFANHPAYPRKHPTGFWQGENALSAGTTASGEQMWSGFGATSTEQKMNETLVQQYNLAPSPDDVARRRELYDKHGSAVDRWPEEVRKFHGEFPDTITVEQLLAAGGGFQGSKGVELDPAKVKALRDE